jgi:SNF family Na+-dependent transporter
LKNPSTWLAAAGQIFFSLSVGFGVIINYASYMRKRDDIALSGLTASVTNEFFEVCLGGLITLPAAFIFLGAAAGSFSTFGLGFNALPNVFALMPYGRIFGFVWFFMLFLAAMTSSLSMLQPVNAFFEEGLGLKKYGSAILLGVVTIIGSGFVLHYSEGLAALDNIDFWCGTFLIVVLALIQSLIYGWVFGADRGLEELDRGALIRLPRFLSVVLKFITPVFLILILVATVWENGPNYVENLQNSLVARRSVYLICIAALFLVVSIAIANYRWKQSGKFDAVFTQDE